MGFKPIHVRSVCFFNGHIRYEQCGLYIDTSFMIGLYTTPTVGTLSMVRPIETHTKGKLQCKIRSNLDISMGRKIKCTMKVPTTLPKGSVQLFTNSAELQKIGHCRIRISADFFNPAKRRWSRNTPYLPMNKIGGPVERVDNPGGLVSEVRSGAERGGRLLADEVVTWEVLSEVVEDEALAGLVRLRHQIYLPPETS
jgi:hypothetical protein